MKGSGGASVLSSEPCEGCRQVSGGCQVGTERTGLGLRGHCGDSGTACSLAAPSGNGSFTDLPVTWTRNDLFGLGTKHKELGRFSKEECLTSFGLSEGDKLY